VADLKTMLERLVPLLKTNYPALLWSLVILGLCSIPGKDVPQVGWDKANHFIVFAPWAVLWYWATKNSLWVLIGGCAYGFFIEIWQGVLPIGRSFDLYDALADGLGVGLGLLIARYVFPKNWP
jgi:branched-subunit amino acid transport protein